MKQKEKPKVANCMMIAPAGINFEYKEDAKGPLWKCRNLGRRFHIYILDMATGKYTPLVLPDTQYFDPREFANVIRMKANRNLFERQNTLLEKLAPFALVAGYGIIGFLMLAGA